MGLIRRNKKGSDSIIQNSDKWEIFDDGTQATRSDIDFTQIEIPQDSPKNLQEVASEVVPDNDSAPTTDSVAKETKKLRKPWIKQFDAYIMKK